MYAIVSSVHTVTMTIDARELRRRKDCTDENDFINYDQIQIIMMR